MPKVQISKDKILETALKLLIREGSKAITISRLAKEMDCSTQPISHTFGSMENFREEFAEYVTGYFYRRNTLIADNPVKMFGSVGVRYLKIAFEEPNLIYFLREHSRDFFAHGGRGTIFEKNKSRDIAKALSAFLGISEENAALFMQTMVTYSKGLVSMVVDGTISISFSESLRRLEEIGKMCLVYLGVPDDKAGDFCRIV